MYYNNQTTTNKQTRSETFLNILYIVASLCLASFTIFCALS